MPVYEYQCQDCGKKFDTVATLAEKEAGLDPVCPKCGRHRARQVFGRFTVLAGSKTEEDFGDGLDDMSPGDDDTGLPGDMDMDGLGDMGTGDYDDLDDID